MTTEEDVRWLCLALPETEERLYERMPSFRVKDKLFARVRDNPYALVAFTPGIAEKEALIDGEPEKFFQTPHYAGHPAVLVRLEAISLSELQEILWVAWRVRAPKKVVAAFEAHTRPSGSG